MNYNENVANINKNNKHCFSPKFVEQDGLRCLYTNTDSLNNKIIEIQSYCCEHKIDLIFICETLPKQNYDKSNIKFIIPGYSALQDNTGRGVALFYKDSLSVTEIPCSVTSTLFCKIKTNKSESFIVALVYRSPNNSVEEDELLLSFLNPFLSNINPVKEKLILVGDFNLPKIDWELETCCENDTNVNFKFLNIMHES